MADVDFFFDPICPWAWITSRWVVEVARLRDLDVEWRFISLRIVNEHRDYETEFPPGYPEIHGLGLRLLRVAAAARQEAGNTAVAALYTEFGRVIHRERRRPEAGQPEVVESALHKAGLPAHLASALDGRDYDPVIREETALALERAGSEVGTPIITFGPPDGPSFFGPVISRLPRGQEAVDLWEAVERLARFRGFAELKRSLRDTLQIP
ncbi:MAG: DsbA family protein [Actinomycetota bacterium]|jgi:2-hydroxychromene-2-carboxylate isomerase|nr:DsbA family protein [Actinomycetota bacterium]